MTAPDRLAELRAAQDEVDAQTLAAASSFPVYEVPAFVAERFPGFDPADPLTWPEPDRCTDGRPFGHSAYSWGVGRPGVYEERWRHYLTYLDRIEAGGKRRSFDPCRNRWKHDDSHLCGTHDKPWRDNLARSIRRQAARERELRHLDLAKRLAVYGIVADGQTAGVLLQADAVEGLLRILEQHVAPF